MYTLVHSHWYIYIHTRGDIVNQHGMGTVYHHPVFDTGLSMIEHSYETGESVRRERRGDRKITE